jgi:hypothetical protein
LLASSFSADGSMLASVELKRTGLVLRSTRTGEVTTSLDPGESNVREIAFSPDGRYVVSRGDTRAVLWDLRAGGRAGTSLLAPGSSAGGVGFDATDVLVVADHKQIAWTTHAGHARTAPRPAATLPDAQDIPVVDMLTFGISSLIRKAGQRFAGIAPLGNGKALARTGNGELYAVTDFGNMLRSVGSADALGSNRDRMAAISVIKSQTALKLTLYRAADVGRELPASVSIPVRRMPSAGALSARIALIASGGTLWGYDVATGAASPLLTGGGEIIKVTPGAELAVRMNFLTPTLWSVASRADLPRMDLQEQALPLFSCSRAPSACRLMDQSGAIIDAATGQLLRTLPPLPDGFEAPVTSLALDWRGPALALSANGTRAARMIQRDYSISSCRS